MIKAQQHHHHHNQPHHAAEYQRRPTRIEVSEAPGLRGKVLATSGAGSGAASKLKCSTISKVPPAKSRIVTSKHQDVQQAPSAPQTDPKQAAQKSQPSRLARLTVAPLRTRPSSLPLKTNKSTPNATLAPAKLTKLELGSNAGSSCKEPQRTSSSARAQQGSQFSVKRKFTSICRQGAATTTTISSVGSASLESRLSGLKNLVAVVHPQHSQQRVNSSATTLPTTLIANGSKPCPTTTTKYSTAPLTPTTTTSTTISSSRTLKNESGKVNLNHKDVNVRDRQETREGKQDGNQIIAARVWRAALTCTDKSNAGFTSAVKSTNAENEDKSGHYKQCGNNSTGHSLSVASSNGDLHGDKKQHENNKQSNKHLSVHAGSNLTIAPGGDARDQQTSNSNHNNNYCYYHDGAKSTLTKSPVIHCDGSNADKASTGGINDHLLPKPLGQQVLSLMMLDVGLMPANGHQTRQQSQPIRRSHVRLASPSKRRQEAKVGENNSPNSYFVNDDQPLIQPPDKNDPFKRLNGFSYIDYKNPEQCNNYHSLQPTTRELLSLQVHLSPHRDNENPRSISMPSSPRIKDRGQINHRRRRRFEKNHATKQGAFVRADDFNCQSELFQERSAFHTKFVSSLQCGDQSKSIELERLLSFSDKQDSLSIASSSCSSLNHYPPLLALSNQLNSLKLDELVKGKVGSVVKGKQNNNLSDSACTIDQCELKSSALTDQTPVAKQHDLLTNDLNTEKAGQKPSKINHVGVCGQHFEDLLANERIFRASAPENSSQPFEQHFNNSDQIFFTDGGSQDPQLRRKQQPRSHSIGGQEYYSNGGYPRLKQSLYTPQQSAIDGQQQYNGQMGGRMHQIPSPYQHQLVNRSPSPLSVASQTHYGSPQREGSIKYPMNGQVKNQLHASLECLNTGYSEYSQNSGRHPHQSQLQAQLPMQMHYQQHQQQNIQNQHYAASYVLAAPPVNAIINQNGDQDLAAAAMGAPPSQYHILPSSGSSSINLSPYNQQTQNIINRAMAQVSHSPSRRAGMHATSSNGTTAGLLSHLTSGLHHPMRAGHSSLSLASSSFIIEDKLQNEIKKLHCELKSEREKNEALNSQLNINSSLMAAFEQSLTTLNTRLRQLTTLNEKKDNEIEELKELLKSSRISAENEKSELNMEETPSSKGEDCEKKPATNSEKDDSEHKLTKIIEDLKRQLIEKDRLLTDTRLEALSAAHQLEQLESKLNGEHSLLVNEDDLDEGVMVVNHSPSDSDAITDSAQFTESNGQEGKSNQRCARDSGSFKNANNNNNMTDHVLVESNNNTDDQSNHSSDYLIDVKEKDDHTFGKSVSQQFGDSDSNVRMGEMIDSLLLSN